MFGSEGEKGNGGVEGKGNSLGSGVFNCFSGSRNQAEVSFHDSTSSLTKSNQAFQRFMKQQCCLNTQCFSHMCMLIPPAVPRPSAKKNLQQSP